MCAGRTFYSAGDAGGAAAGRPPRAMSQPMQAKASPRNTSRPINMAWAKATRSYRSRNNNGSAVPTARTLTIIHNPGRPLFRTVQDTHSFSRFKHRVAR